MLYNYSTITSLAAQNNVLFNVMIELCNTCNWRCKHCYIPEHGGKNLDVDAIKKLLGELRALGCFDITLTGGEIFTRDDIMDIVRICRQEYFNVNLFSNISLLTEKKISQLAEQHISLISCTVFSLNESIHDSITQVNGSLKQTLRNIELIRRYGIPLEIKTILMKDNYKEFYDLIEYCDKRNIGYKVDQEIFIKLDKSDCPKELRMSYLQLLEVIQDIDNIRGFDKINHKDSDELCSALSSSCIISNEGDVYPCSKMRIKIGNIFEKSMSEIWNMSHKLKELRQYKWKDLTVCNKCEIKEFCNPCPGIAFLEDGNYLGKCSMCCELANIRAIYRKK